MLFLLSAPMLVVMALRHRFWCRYLCPVGLITETCGKLRRERKVDDEGQESTQRGTNKRVRVPFSTGRFLALTSLGGAIAGYPLFLWMDPLALFSGFFNFSQASVAGLVIVMLISIASPGLWCSRICPLGGTQDLLVRLAGRSTKTCRNARFSQRRVLLAAGLGAVFSAIIPRALLAKKHHLRPPGSIDETAFKGACIRCGNCIRSCPSGIIEPSVDSRDVAGFLVPKLRFSGPDYCREDCNKCGQVCPTGVIRPLPLQDKNRRVIGVAEIDLSECLLTMDEECGVCMPRCPQGAITEQFSRETYTATVKVVPGKCNGCGACVGICPAKVVRVETVSARSLQHNGRTAQYQTVKTIGRFTRRPSHAS
jgi:ferredoxin